MSPPAFVPVILCGGQGARLRPISRPSLPKPFVPFARGPSLLIRTLQRLKVFSSVLDPVLVTSEPHADIVRTQCAFAGAPGARVLGESRPSGTTMAIATALADLALQRVPSSTPVVIFPADHLIDPACSLVPAISRALSGLDHFDIALLGVPTSCPDPALGYILASPDPASPCGVRRVLSFLEKPAPHILQSLVPSSDAFANTGIAVARPDTLRDRISTFLSSSAASSDPGPRGSFDQDILQSSSSLGFVTLDAHWRDVGTLPSFLRNERELLLGTSPDLPSFVRSERRVHGQIPSDLVLIDSRDSLFFADVSSLSCTPTPVLPPHEEPHFSDESFVSSPWGGYQVLARSPELVVKVLTILPFSALSLQAHCYRSERWSVVSGSIRARVGQRSLALETGATVDIPIGVLHQLENPTATAACVVEVQSGPLLEESDIVRFDDRYGRTTVPSPFPGPSTLYCA